MLEETEKAAGIAAAIAKAEVEAAAARETAA
jgi:hypothetical protein